MLLKCNKMSNVFLLKSVCLFWATVEKGRGKALVTLEGDPRQKLKYLLTEPKQ